MTTFAPYHPPGGPQFTSLPELPDDPTKVGAAQVIRAQLREWGIEDLYADVLRLMKQGLSEDAIIIQLQDTDSYKKRFAANELRRKAGLAALSPAEYVATETQYRSVMRSYGLPAGFYDSNDDLVRFLGNDVSPAELATRAQVAQQVWLTGNQEYKSVWTDFYGLSDGDAIAAILDPKAALPIIEQKRVATQIAAAGRRNNVDVERDRAEYFTTLGIDENAAIKAYGDIGQVAGVDSAIAQRFGTTFGQEDEEDARLLGLASARRKQRELYGKETALFSGGSGVDRATFARPQSGAY